MRLFALVCVLVAVGVAAAVAVADVTTNTATSCATTNAATYTLVQPATTQTFGGDSLSVCATATATATGVTTTVPGPTTTVTTTVGTTTATAPPPTGGKPGVGYEDETGHLTNVSNPDQFSILWGGAWSSDVSVIENAAGRGLVYFDGTDVKQSYSTGVPYSDASANGWLLKDSSGNLLENTTYASYCADVGSSGYQNEWISNVESYLASHAGVDGIFIDNVLYDPKGDCGAYPAKYPTTASWDTAMVGFVKAVYTALHAKGYYVALNAGAFKSGDSTYNDGTSTIAWWQQLGPYADGLTNEYYDETSDGTDRLRTTAAAWYGDFDQWQRLIGTAQSDGDDFIGITYGAAGDTTAMTFARASFLLEWNGHGSAFIYKIKGSSADASDPSWTTDIGQPIGAKSAVGVGYERSYTGGTVLVNPSPSSSQSFTVNGTNYTLSPTTAKIITG